MGPKVGMDSLEKRDSLPLPNNRLKFKRKYDLLEHGNKEIIQDFGKVMFREKSTGKSEKMERHVEKYLNKPICRWVVE